MKSILKIPEVILVVKIYIIGILLGVIYGFIFIKSLDQFLKLLGDLFADIIAQGLNQDFLGNFLLIFKNNITATLIILFLGLIHRYLSLLALFSNGFLLGLVGFGMAVFAGGLGQLWMIVPHGIIEIPTLLLTIVTSVQITLRAKNFTDRFKVLFSLRERVALIVALLIVAAVIESALIVTYSP